ncbi:hypothetical protein CC80DRAFT_327980 [Byssothecium circinans]|uniref:Uncharacterized protein n=1 Tax=Byssothecium circinans TaxID=147558 RepID=A0A6A5T7S0_9PLEO|nr:hypothetical protein CC80DRAFT_327980 [Byssothecium circinans]
MVDQNMSPNTPAGGGHAPDQSPNSKTPTNKQPDVVQAGQWMLIFALVLIFLVCCALAAHFYLRRQKRRRRKKVKKTKKNSKEDMEEDGPLEAELHSKQKEIAELIGTPICEMGEPEPRYEMEDAEVHERRYTMLDWPLQNPADNPVVSPMDRDLEAGTFFGEMNSAISPMQPDARVYAAYWGRAM